MMAFIGELFALLWIMGVCKHGPYDLTGSLTYHAGYWYQIVQTRLVWLSATFLLLGGGSRVYISMLSSILTDVAPESVR